MDADENLSLERTAAQLEAALGRVRADLERDVPDSRSRMPCNSRPSASCCASVSRSFLRAFAMTGE